MENFNFDNYWELTKEATGIEDGSKKNFVGFIKVKDVDEVVDKTMREWVLLDKPLDILVEIFHLIEQLIIALAPLFTKRFWKELFSKREKHPKEIAEVKEKFYYNRYITPKEFYDVFNEQLGLQLERDLERAKYAREDRIRRQAENAANSMSGEAKTWGEKLDRDWFDKPLYSGVIKAFDSNKEEQEVYERFYRLYPAYALFKIKNERDRRLVASRLQDDEAYFTEMRKQSPTLADFFLTSRRFKIPEKERAKHTYIVAGTGAGKSEFVKSLIWQHINYGKTGIVVLDPNGDFAEQVAKFSENASPKHREKLVYIDPNLSLEHVPVINPFDLPDASEATLDRAVQQMFKTFQQAFEDLKTPATAAMETILLNTIPVIFQKPDGSLWDLYRFNDDKTNADLIELGKSMKNPAIRNFFEHKYYKEMKVSKEGLESRIMRMVSSSTFMSLVSGKSTINLKQAIDSKKLIIFNLSKGKLGEDLSRVYGRFVLTTILNIILSRADLPPERRVPCHVYIDEFHNYVTSTIKEAFTEGRKYGGYLTVVTQTIGQDMTTEFKDVLIGNANVKIIGGAGYKSRREMAQEMDIDDDTEKITGISKKSFKKLEVGEFIVQIGNKLPFKMKNRKGLLGNKNSMTTEEWVAIKSEQLQKYYSERSSDETLILPPITPSADRTEDSIFEIPKKLFDDRDEKRPFTPKYDV